MQVNKCKLKCHSTVLPTKYRLLSLCNMCYLLARSYKCTLLETCFDYEKGDLHQSIICKLLTTEVIDFFGADFRWHWHHVLQMIICKQLQWVALLIDIFFQNPPSYIFFDFCNDQSSKLCHITSLPSFYWAIPCFGIVLNVICCVFMFKLCLCSFLYWQQLKTMCILLLSCRWLA